MTGDPWLTLVRVARDLGDMSLVVPEGYDGLADAPFDLVENVRQALVFLSWLENENLAAGDVPPRRIWLDGEKLEAHFREVARRQRERYGLPAEDDGEWVENPLASELVVG